MMNYDEEEKNLDSTLESNFMNTKELSIWKQNENGQWVLVFNKINHQDEIFDKEIEKFSYIKNNKKQSTTFECINFKEASLNKKPKVGSLVMTPEGIASLIKILDNIATVKFDKNNLTQNFEEKSVVTHFPIYLKLIISIESINCYRINIPADGDVSLIINAIYKLKVFNTEDFNFSLFHKGQEIKEDMRIQQIPNLLSGDKFFISDIKKTENTINRYTELRQYRFQNPEQILFSVNKAIKLSGIGLYLTIGGESQVGTLYIFEIEGEATNTSSGRRVRRANRTGRSGIRRRGAGSLIYFLENVTIPYSSSENLIHKLAFPKPLKIKPYRNYKIVFVYSICNKTWYGNGGLSTQLGIKNVEFTFSSDNNKYCFKNGNFPEFYYYV